MKQMYFTIAGCNHYYGNDFMKKGMKVKLEKEPDNDYDMGVGIMVTITRMDVNLVEIKVAGQCNNSDR